MDRVMEFLPFFDSACNCGICTVGLYIASHFDP